MGVFWSPTAAPRPAPRDQRPRRGRGRWSTNGSCSSLPASCPLLPLRDGRGYAHWFCDCRSLFALWDEGRRGNFECGWEQSEAAEKEAYSDGGSCRRGSWVTGTPTGQSAQLMGFLGYWSLTSSVGSPVDCPPTMKLPLDPSVEEGREETGTANPLSVAQAKRSDRTGHDASIREGVQV